MTDDGSELAQDGLHRPHLLHDPTNWWEPNHPGALAMLRSAGFQVLSRPGDEIYVCKPNEETRENAQWNRSEMADALGLRRECETM